MEQGYRSEVQERALVVSLQMFSLILERGVSLLKAQLDSGQEPRLVVGEDLQVLLPAIKVPFPLLSVIVGQCVSVERSLNCVSRRGSANVSQFPSRNVRSITSIVRGACHYGIIIRSGAVPANLSTSSLGPKFNVFRSDRWNKRVFAKKKKFYSRLFLFASVFLEIIYSDLSELTVTGPRCDCNQSGRRRFFHARKPAENL